MRPMQDITTCPHGTNIVMAHGSMSCPGAAVMGKVFVASGKRTQTTNSV